MGKFLAMFGVQCVVKLVARKKQRGYERQFNKLFHNAKSSYVTWTMHHDQCHTYIRLVTFDRCSLNCALPLYPLLLQWFNGMTAATKYGRMLRGWSASA